MNKELPMRRKQKMVLGFLFDDLGASVALIEKQHPEWQRGLLNGIGGKVEEGESPLAAMIREFKEETGVVQEDWQHFATMIGGKWAVACYKANNTKALQAVRTTTDEIVCIVSLPDLHRAQRMRNLDMLISIALDKSELLNPPTLEY